MVEGFSREEVVFRSYPEPVLWERASFLIPFEHICTFGSRTVNDLVCGNIHLLFISKPATRSLHQIAFTSCIRRNGQNLFPVDPFCVGQELLDSALSSLFHARQPWALGHHTAHMQPRELGVCLRDLDSLGWVFNWNLEFFLSPKPAKLFLKLQVKIFSSLDETNRPGCAIVLESPPPLSSQILALKGHCSLLENLPYCKCKEASGCSWCSQQRVLAETPCIFLLRQERYN